MVWKNRSASHANDWYEGKSHLLSEQLQHFIAKAGPRLYSSTKGVIVPHAGYAYSAPTAAHAFKEIDIQTTKRVFILGPSHHYHLTRCAVTRANIYETPVGNLTIDRAVTQELLATREFEEMSPQADEDEHSIEMQLPFLAHLQNQGAQFTIVPILVGAIHDNGFDTYGRIFAPYLQAPGNVFVISSDFCHWGSRFQYQFYKPEWGEIHESINKLDHLGIEIIEKLDFNGFRHYLREYRNTVCGRHPIMIFLKTIELLKSQISNLEFHSLSYAQSSPCMNMRHSSVSYYAGALTFDV